MPKEVIEKFVITADCRHNGKVLKKGSTVEFNMSQPAEAQTVAILNRNGRLLEATADNIAMINQEVKQEAEREKRLAAMASRGAPALAAA